MKTLWKNLKDANYEVGMGMGNKFLSLYPKSKCGKRFAPSATFEKNAYNVRPVKLPPFMSMEMWQEYSEEMASATSLINQIWQAIQIGEIKLE